jgi:hypothetical protein
MLLVVMLSHFLLLCWMSCHQLQNRQTENTAKKDIITLATDSVEYIAARAVSAVSIDHRH